MKLSDFKFNVPEELIAQEPARFRDESRLLVLHRKTGEIEHCVFKELCTFFDPHDLFIFNDTKVFPAKIYGNKEKTNADVEVFLLRELNPDSKFWDTIVEPARKIRIGNKLYFGEDNSLMAEVIDNTTSRGRTIRFLYDSSHDKFKSELMAMGHTPLPPYIHRRATEEDSERYQCIFAKNEGAVMAPHAGMHFSREMFKRMEIYDLEWQFLTLHCGLGNYNEIDVEDLSKHRLDSEQMTIDSTIVNSISEARKRGNRVCAVGATTMRALETAATLDGYVKEYSGWSNKFIYPPYDFSICQAMVTNFHFPLTAMLMLTCAFGGYDQVMNAYEVAIQEKYRFGGYGDAMLIID